VGLGHALIVDDFGADRAGGLELREDGGRPYGDVGVVLWAEEILLVEEFELDGGPGRWPGLGGGRKGVGFVVGDGGGHGGVACVLLGVGCFGG